MGERKFILLLLILSFITQALAEETVSLNVELLQDQILPGDYATGNLTIKNLGEAKPIYITLYYAIRNTGQELYSFREESLALDEETTITRRIKTSDTLPTGEYAFYARIIHEENVVESQQSFSVTSEVSGEAEAQETQQESPSVDFTFLEGIITQENISKALTIIAVILLGGAGLVLAALLIYLFYRTAKKIVHGVKGEAGRLREGMEKRRERAALKKQEKEKEKAEEREKKEKSERKRKEIEEKERQEKAEREREELEEKKKEVVQEEPMIKETEVKPELVEIKKVIVKKHVKKPARKKRKTKKKRKARAYTTRRPKKVVKIVTFGEKPEKKKKKTKKRKKYRRAAEKVDETKELYKALKEMKEEYK